LPGKILKHLRNGTFSAVLSKKTVTIFKRLGIYRRNFINILRYGPSAPRVAEIIWVHPENCNMALVGYGQEVSGRVIETSWPVERVKPVTEIRKIKFCIAHWVNGIPWEDTGAYEFVESIIKEKGSHDGCESINDIVKRYENLDTIFKQVKREGRLRAKKEIDHVNYWKGEEIIIHIGPDGELYFSGMGIHRFAIAYILKVPLPAQVGFVHVSAIPLLDNLRKNDPCNQAQPPVDISIN